MPTDRSMSDMDRIWVTVECPECGAQSDRVVEDGSDPDVGDVGRAECGHCGHETGMEVVNRVE